MAEFHPSGNYLCHIRQPRSSTTTSWQSPQPDSHRCADNPSDLISPNKILNISLARINKHHWSRRKILKINVTKNQPLTYYCSAGGYHWKHQAYFVHIFKCRKLARFKVVRHGWLHFIRLEITHAISGNLAVQAPFISSAKLLLAYNPNQHVLI